MRHKQARVPDDFSSFKSPVGDLFHDVFTPSFRADGILELKVTDRVDIKKEINSHLEETDMAFILSRLMAGDDSVLNPRPPMYGDFTQLPTSYAEMLNMVLDGERYFDSLPLEVRNKFDNDRSKWFATIGSDSWLDNMGFVSSETGSSSPVSPTPVVPDQEILKDVIE